MKENTADGSERWSSARAVLRHPCARRGRHELEKAAGMSNGALIRARSRCADTAQNAQMREPPIPPAPSPQCTAVGARSRSRGWARRRRSRSARCRPCRTGRQRPRLQLRHSLASHRRRARRAAHGRRRRRRRSRGSARARRRWSRRRAAASQAGPPRRSSARRRHRRSSTPQRLPPSATRSRCRGSPRRATGGATDARRSGCVPKRCPRK